MLVVIVSVGLAWLGVKVRRIMKSREAAADTRRMEAEIRRLGERVSVRQHYRNRRPDWLETLLDDPGTLTVVEVEVPPEFDDGGMVHLKGLAILQA